MVGGSGTCFRLSPPCGNLPPQKPRYLFYGGYPYFLKWQQNYNHYEVGYPGYMDIAVAPDVNSDNFTTLAVVMDRYEYAQDHQRNYTAVIIIPNMNCDHCVLRARYNPHKPGETTFYQCSDISIRTVKMSDFSTVPPSDEDFNQIRKVHELSQQYSHGNQYKLKSDMNLYGFAYNPFESSVLHYVSIDLNTGSISLIKDFDFGFGSVENQSEHPLKFQRMSEKLFYRKAQSAVDYKFMLESVMSVNKDKGTLGLMLHERGELDDPASTLMEITASDGNILRSTKIANFDGSAINALLYMSPNRYLTLSIESASSEGYYFVVGEISDTGVYKRLMSSGIEPLYVNFQFMEVYNDLLLLLMGNENAADALNARIYIFNLTSM
ncbi:hypothetical protein CHS0354_018879 [Potamilus streckersoni]|uniref:Uncharacterized protein n=1 Tax=Potamilus streckersoni TaxID=2493646 RepID=A0AAE0SCJ3_9BIVA|nr:hypothetical protein CHS0354_018879 [Potamilus streckersoni]